jgi:ribosomal protein S18 acetylase RimI-like enzyme
MSEGDVVHIVHMGAGDEARVQEAEALFDDAVSPTATAAFLRDERHHLLIAYLGGRPVGFISAAELLHPDKPRPEMFVNELGVLPAFTRRGIATSLINELLEVCRARRCSEMWVLTDEHNVAAIATYHSTGGRREPPGQVMFTYDLD